MLGYVDCDVLLNWIELYGITLDFSLKPGLLPCKKLRMACSFFNPHQSNLNHECKTILLSTSHLSNRPHFLLVYWNNNPTWDIERVQEKQEGVIYKLFEYPPNNLDGFIIPVKP